MSLLHVVYAMAVGVLLTGAATLVEGALRGAERPARLVWLLALAATVAAPWWGPRTAADPVSIPASAPPAGAVPAATPTVPAHSTLDRLAAGLAVPVPGLAWIWWGLAGLGVGVVAVGLVRLERRAARWPRTRIEGEEVSISRDFGPALVGLRRPRTVLPGWALTLARRELALILEHEQAHRRAGDAATLALGLLTAAACAWNPVVWWQYRRLRDAVEMDCDRRLLRRGVPVAAYARVLVLVRLRAAAPGGATAALVESKSSLERRLKTMRAFPWTRRKVALSGALALGLVVVACETPAPSPVDVEPEAAAAETETVFEAQETAGSILKRMPGGAPDGPLIVVDGVVRDDAVLADLAALLIERIEVVKGGAAREFYGERGANGVVRITTKEGAATAGEARFEEREVPLPKVRLHETRPRRDGAEEEVPFGTFRLREVPADRSGGGR